MLFAFTGARKLFSTYGAEVIFPPGHEHFGNLSGRRMSSPQFLNIHPCLNLFIEGNKVTFHLTPGESAFTIYIHGGGVGYR